MMKKRINLFFTSLAMLFSLAVVAQSEIRETPEMAEVMRSNGKIYVVVVIAGMVFLGIILFLIHLDRKISRLEKEH